MPKNSSKKNEDLLRAYMRNKLPQEQTSKTIEVKKKPGGQENMKRANKG